MCLPPMTASWGPPDSFSANLTKPDPNQVWMAIHLQMKDSLPPMSAIRTPSGFHLDLCTRTDCAFAFRAPRWRLFVFSSLSAFFCPASFGALMRPTKVTSLTRRHWQRDWATRIFCSLWRGVSPSLLPMVSEVSVFKCTWMHFLFSTNTNTIFAAGLEASVRSLFNKPVTTAVYALSMLVGVVAMLAFYESPSKFYFCFCSRLCWSHIK